MQPVRVNPFWFMGSTSSNQSKAQQGDPLRPLEFCEAIHPLLTNLQSTVKIGFMDDITLVGDICTVEADVNTINNHDADTGLKVNISKCEIIAEYTAAIPDSSLLSEFVKVTKDIIRTTG